MEDVLGFENIATWASREGKRFEVEAYVHYKELRRNDPIAPIALSNLPKSVVNELFSSAACTETMENAQTLVSSTAVVTTGTHRGKDYVTFPSSEESTQVKAPCGTYVVPVLTEAKINPSDARQLYSTKLEFEKIKTQIQWGSVHKHYKLVVPEHVTVDNQPALTRIADSKFLNHVVENSRRFATQKSTAECETIRIPFIFQAPLYRVVQGTHTYVDRPWQIKATDEVNFHLNEGERLVLLDAACGAGKTQCMHKLSYEWKLWKFDLTINLFPRIVLSEQMGEKYACYQMHTDRGADVRKRFMDFLEARIDPHQATAPKRTASMCYQAFDDDLILLFKAFMEAHPQFHVLFVGDEAHMLKCEDKLETLLAIPNVSMVCLSATVPLKWNFNPTLTKMFVNAPYVHGISVLESIRLGYTMTPTFRLVKPRHAEERLQALMEYTMRESQARNTLVICTSTKEALEFVKLFYDHDNCGCCVISLSKSKRELQKEAETMYSTTTFLDRAHINDTKTFRDACLQSFDSSWTGKKNQMVSILKCVVGADYPGVDNVLCTRPLEDKSYRHCSPGQLLLQYMRQTRIDDRHDKQLAEITLLHEDANCKAVAEWFELYDPDEECAAAYVWKQGASAKEQLLPSFLPNVDVELQRARYRVRENRASELRKTLELHHYDEIAISFVKAHKGVPQLALRKGAKGNIAFTVNVQGRGVNFETSEVVGQLIKRFNDKKLSDDAMTALGSHSGFMSQINKPSMSPLPPLPFKKPKDYDTIRSKLNSVPFDYEVIRQFVLDLCGVNLPSDGWINIFKLLCGKPPYVYEFKVRPENLDLLRKLCEGKDEVKCGEDSRCHIDLYPGDRNFHQNADLFVIKERMDKYVTGNDTGNGGLSSALGKLFLWQEFESGYRSSDEMVKRKLIVEEVRKKRAKWDLEQKSGKPSESGHSTSSSVFFENWLNSERSTCEPPSKQHGSGHFSNL